LKNNTISEEIENEFKNIKSNVLDNDISPEKIKSFIEHDGFYKKGTPFRNLVFDEINEVVDNEMHLRPFNIKNTDLTIEHICPQSLNAKHPNLHKIGNLCILTKKRNSSFSNTANWCKKYKTYIEYPWAINKSLMKYGDKFTLDEEFKDRNNILCNAFVKAMEIGENITKYSEIVYV